MTKVDPELEAIVSDAIVCLKLITQYQGQPTPRVAAALVKDAENTLAKLFAYQAIWYSDPRIRQFEERANGQKGRSPA